MAIPVYLWLKDDGGADIKGSVDVRTVKAALRWSLRSITCTSRPTTTPAS
jgi:hypothetical protein